MPNLAVNNSSNMQIKPSAHLALMRQANNAQNPVHNIPIEKGAKCPHGFPGGACPICMGKTGGGGGANNSKKATGMSWGEATYIYNRLQTVQRNQIDDQKALEASRLLNKLMGKLEQSRLFQTMLAMKNAALANLTALKNVLVQAGQTITKTVAKTVNNIVNVVKTSVTKLIGVANKLTAILGEKIRNIGHAIQENIKKLIAKMLQIERLNRLFQMFDRGRQILCNFLLSKIESLQEKIKKFADIIQSIMEKDSKDRENKKKKDKKQKKHNEEKE